MRVWPLKAGEHLRAANDFVHILLERRNTMYGSIQVELEDPWRVPVGIVQSAGPGAWSDEAGDRLPMEFEAGDRVWLNEYQGCEFYGMGADGEQETHVLINAHEINCKVPLGSVIEIVRKD